MNQETDAGKRSRAADPGINAGAARASAAAVVSDTGINSGVRVLQQRALAATLNSGARMLQLKALRETINGGGPMRQQAAPADAVDSPLQMRRPNHTGLPDQLKSGIESLSGMSMDHVRVHHNSSQPAQLNALAYAQGSDIHLGPGQQQHLAHEAWHVVQQAQGRVRPTMQMKQGIAVNDNPGLEREADLFGEKALRLGGVANAAPEAGHAPAPAAVIPVVQAQFDEHDRELRAGAQAALTAHFADKGATMRHRAQTQKVLSTTDNPRAIIATVGMQRPDELAPRFAENSIEQGKEDMPYYHHAQMVMGQYNKYFSQQVKRDDKAAVKVGIDESLISDRLMRMMLAFHDINKQNSLEKHGKIGEHVDTVSAMSEFSRDWGFSAQEIRIACEMVGADPFGDYFKQVGDINANLSAIGGDVAAKELLEQARERCFVTIAKAAANAGVPGGQMDVFFERYLMFYQSDFSSYMTDSSYQDKYFKPGREQERSADGAPDAYHGPDSFTPEFFAHKAGKESPLALAGNQKRLEFASEKKLTTSARDLEEMFEPGKVAANLERLAPANLLARAAAKDHRNESRRANMEMTRASAKERMRDNPYINFEQPVTKLSEALGKLGSAENLSLAVLKLGTLTENDAPRVAREYNIEAGVAVTIIQACRALRRMMVVDGSDDDVIGQFNQGGVFIRKLLPEDNSSSRAIVDKDVNTMEQYVLREPITPFVMPSTLVLKNVPVNLTNAQEALQHSSGLIFDQNTRIAPSTKEHNESASLSRVLTEPVRGRIHDEETWKSVVRPPIGKMGGKSYDTRQGLENKLVEMELRRRGQIPDLSTKELLFEVLSMLGDGDRELQMGDFDKALEMYSQRWLLPEFITQQLRHKFTSVQRDKIQKSLVHGGIAKKYEKVDVGNRLAYIRIALTQPKRQDRGHSIYGGTKDGRAEMPGNRYHRADKKVTKHGSSEAEGYDGVSFQTNEVLMLPDGVDFISAIYSNSYSIASRLHSLNLTRELLMQTGRLPNLYNYSALQGMSRTSLFEVLDEIHQRLGRGEAFAPSSGLVYDKKKPDEPEAAKSEEPVKLSSSSSMPVNPLAAMLNQRQQTSSSASSVGSELEGLAGLVKNFSGRQKIAGVESAKKVWMPERQPDKDRGI